MDMELLESRGISSGSYKKIFSGPHASYPPRVKALVDLISNRARRGITTCLDEWRGYAAIDTAYDVDFQQTTPTMIRNIVGRHWDDPRELEAAVSGCGLSMDTLFIKEETVLADGTKGIGLIPNVPVFFGILIPLVKAYVTIRLAKIFNERNLSPLLEYKPLKETSRNQVLCEIITDLVETQSNWYGYPAVLKQAIQQMLKYGVALSFPYEEWHCEEQEEQNEDGTEETVTIKEGLRYYLPHPTRMFYDPSYPLTTINSDTGVSWLGHWTVKTYGDIVDNKNYWNRKHIFSGTNWFGYGGASYYFEEFFPCVMADAYTRRFRPGLTREDKLAWYNNSDRDQAVFITEEYMKLTPSDWALGKYDGKATEKKPKGTLVDTYHHPVWHRFVLAGDDTVLWAEPMAYCPSWFFGYQYDAQAWQQRSLGLETIPWQDLVGDLLNHIVDVAKQNLINVTFYDQNIVDKGDIEKLKKLGARLFRGPNFVGYDPLLNQRAGVNIERAFLPMKLDKQSIVELLQALPIVLNIMERVLQITAQEVGAAASHQQGKEEILQTGSASTNGVLFTSAGVDEGTTAWKKQLYDALMAYKDPEFSAQVSADIPDLEEHISELGFEKTHEGRNKILVTGHKEKLRLEGFAAIATGPTQGKEKELAQLVFSVVSTVCGQEVLFKQIGAKNIVNLISEAVKFAGGPRDFDLQLQPEGEEDQEVPQPIIEAIQAAQKATLQAVEQKIAMPVGQEVAQLQQQQTTLEQVVKQLENIYKVASQLSDKTQVEKEKTAAKLALKAQESAAALQRKNVELQANLQRKATETAAKIEMDKQKAVGQLQVESVKAHHAANLETAQAAHTAALAEKTADSSKEPAE